MRLIDADRLSQEVFSHEYSVMVLETENKVLGEVLTMIHNAPTVEVPIPSGYKLVKRPDYDCSCYLDYPNKNYCRKNGHWKCVDDYEYIGQSKNNLTHCRRKKK